MDAIISFFVSVAANIASHYVRKWLDQHGKGQLACHSKSAPQRGAISLGGAF